MNNKELGVILMIVGVAVYFPIFLHLDYGGLYRWDESNNAIHAYEMAHNGIYLRRFFLGEPETWETKPPLLTWLQVFCMKFLGYNELSVRLPSALATLFTVVLLVRFYLKDLKNLWGGIFSSLVLLTSAGYVRGHVTRTGDHDALLILFLVLGLIYFYKYLWGNSKNKSIILFTVFFICGILTKSIAGLFYAPGIFIFTLYSRKLIPTWTDKRFWISVLSIIFIVFGYYLIVEIYYPGYLKLVWENELFPRYFNASEAYDYNQMPEPFYFTKILFEEHFKWYIWLVPISIALIFFRKKNGEDRFIWLVLLTALSFQLVISNGTYNSWYNAPLFPLLAIIVGHGLSILFENITRAYQINRIKYYSISVFFVIAFFVLPYKEIILKECYFKEHNGGDDNYGAFMNKLRKKEPELKNYIVFHEFRNRHFLFYKNIYNDKYNYKIESCRIDTLAKCFEKDSMKSYSKIMVCNDEFKARIKEKYEVKPIEQDKNCELLMVLD